MALRPEHLWAPETRSQLRPCHLDGHRDKTLGTRWVLYTIWLCCSCNKLLVRLARGELSPPDWAWFLQRFFSPFCHRWEFWFLAAVASGLLSWGHFISSDIIDFIAQILYKLKWAGKLHHSIQYERPLTKNVVFNLVTLHYWHIILLFWYWKVVFDTIYIVKSAIQIKVTWLVVVFHLMCCSINIQ